MMDTYDSEQTDKHTGMMSLRMYSAPDFDMPPRRDTPSPHSQCPYLECVVCGLLIQDRYVLRMSDETYYHEACLQCCQCGDKLSNHNVCYKKAGQIYCRSDYLAKFSERCARCDRVIAAQTDWIRRACTLVFHLACFSCDVCSRQLSTGESFKLNDNRILCEKHCVDPDNQKEELNQKAKTKRVRTTFTEEQLKILSQNFMVDSNPDGQDLERIANLTGLSKRVTQVWFQNSRARQKKHQQQSPGDKKLLNNNNNSNTSNNNAYAPGLLSGIPSVGSEHSHGSELHSDMHSFAGSEQSTGDEWSHEDDERMSAAGLTGYMLE